MHLISPEFGITLPMFFGPHDNDDVPFPNTLEPGKSYSVWKPGDILARTLTDKNLGRDLVKPTNPEGLDDTVYSGRIKIKGEYSDMADRSYKSGWVNVDLDEWMRSFSK